MFLFLYLNWSDDSCFNSKSDVIDLKRYKIAHDKVEEKNETYDGDYTSFYEHKQYSFLHLSYKCYWW